MITRCLPYDWRQYIYHLVNWGSFLRETCDISMVWTSNLSKEHIQQVIILHVLIILINSVDNSSNVISNKNILFLTILHEPVDMFIFIAAIGKVSVKSSFAKFIKEPYISVIEIIWFAVFFSNKLTPVLSWNSHECLKLVVNWSN